MRRRGNTYKFRLRPSVKILAGEVRRMLKLLHGCLSLLTVLRSQMIQSGEDEGSSFHELDAVRVPHGRSQAIIGRLKDA